MHRDHLGVGSTKIEQRANGFTVLELVAVVLIVVALAALLIPNYDKVVAAAQQAVCASHMRTIRLGLGDYLNDHGMVWPQGPLPQEKGWATFWIRTLEPYHVSADTWKCPTILAKLKNEHPEGFDLHYSPTAFDATKNVAYKWTTQPWLIEAANAHGNGPLILFPDGSIKPFFKVLAEQGVR